MVSHRRPAVLAAGTGTWHASAAAFSVSTAGPGSQWQAGSVAVDATSTRTATAFSAASFSYATGVDGWAATTAATRTYQIKWQPQDDNAARDRTGSLTFTWEARTT